MRLLVLGTSNSILKGGYVDALSNRTEIAHLDRIGPGGSTSIMLPYFGAEVDFGSYDYLILDTSVNDGAFASWGALTQSEIIDNLRWLCHNATISGCSPVFLCMPNRTFLEGQDPTLASYLLVASEFSIPVLDGYQAVRQMAADDDLPVADFFIDDLHLRPEVAVRLAPQLLAMCCPVVRNPSGSDIPSFRCIEAGDLALPQQERRTSLLSARGATLSPDAEVEVILEDDEVLSGLVYNAGHTFGSIIFSGLDKMAMNVRSHYYQKNDLVVAARQISPGMQAKDGRVSIRMQRDADAIAEIVGLIVRLPGVRMH